MTQPLLLLYIVESQGVISSGGGGGKSNPILALWYKGLHPIVTIL
jgi:hypothetical protein